MPPPWSGRDPESEGGGSQGPATAASGLHDRELPGRAIRGPPCAPGEISPHKAGDCWLGYAHLLLSLLASGSALIGREGDENPLVLVPPDPGPPDSAPALINISEFMHL